MTDELERRMRAADPMPPSVPVDPARSPRADALMEDIMTQTQLPDTPAERPASDVTPLRRRFEPWQLVAAAAAVVALAVGGIALAGGDDGGPGEMAGGDPAADPVASGDTATFSLPDGADSALASCIALDAEVLRGVDVAFDGTATAVGADTVTLTVNTWYKGGDAAAVQLATVDAAPALIDGFEFEQGQRYLITATAGTVNFCGFSQPYSAELEAIFVEAFAS